ncbi:hypothetical protein ACNJX9_25985 [Bradyrhizobium sp. DASA03076]|uniref:hypothetical protein n=1 Tax=Bradyrhizobium sp. BLXBL-03 TaxID=3395916 RepID=UPI003F6E7698
MSEALRDRNGRELLDYMDRFVATLTNAVHVNPQAKGEDALLGKEVRFWPEGEDRNGIRHFSSRGQTGQSGDVPKST